MKNELERVLVWTILKCEFGWGGAVPSKVDEEELETISKDETKKPLERANKMAVLLFKGGAKFVRVRARQPNQRLVIDGYVYARQGK